MIHTVFFTSENHNGTKTLKQHVFVRHMKRVPFTDEWYEGNRPLCRHKGGIYNDDIGRFEKLENIKPEKPSENTCKRCLSILKNAL